MLRFIRENSLTLVMTLLFVLALLAARSRIGMSRPAVLGAILGVAAPVLVLVFVAVANTSPGLAAIHSCHGVPSAGVVPYPIRGRTSGRDRGPPLLA